MYLIHRQKDQKRSLKMFIDHFFHDSHHKFIFQDPALSHNASPQISQIMLFQIEELFGMPQINFSQTEFDRNSKQPNQMQI